MTKYYIFIANGGLCCTIDKQFLPEGLPEITWTNEEYCKAVANYNHFWYSEDNKIMMEKIEVDNSSPQIYYPPEQLINILLGVE